LIPRGSGFSTGAAWVDYDRDGHLDFFDSRCVHVDVYYSLREGQGVVGKIALPLLIKAPTPK